MQPSYWLLLLTAGIPIVARPTAFPILTRYEVIAPDQPVSAAELNEPVSDSMIALEEAKGILDDIDAKMEAESSKDSRTYNYLANQRADAVAKVTSAVDEYIRDRRNPGVARMGYIIKYLGDARQAAADLKGKVFSEDAKRAAAAADADIKKYLAFKEMVCKDYPKLTGCLEVLNS